LAEIADISDHYIDPLSSYLQDLCLTLEDRPFDDGDDVNKIAAVQKVARILRSLQGTRC
jgi:hypothetical protein